jgi:outer membrane lipoprotein-sorting protein
MLSMPRLVRPRRPLAWSAPALVAAFVVGVAVWPQAASADAHPTLPARTPAQLLADAQNSNLQHFSGTVVETSRLGIPALPGADSAALTWQTFVSGSHTLRVWADGPDRQRVALLAQLSESDVIRNGANLWTFASDTQNVGHRVLSATGADKGMPAPAELTAHTPVGVADEALKSVDPTTRVTVDRTQRVAGRPAYTLVLEPRDTRSTVRRVAIALDAQRKLPLRVQIYGAGVKPAVEIGFTQVSFGRPSSSTFAFTPPRGSTVSKELFPLRGDDRSPSRPDAGQVPGAATSTRTVGTGWTSVLVVSGAGDLAAMGAGRTVDRLLVAQRDGSRLLQTALVNVLVTSDGTIAVGAVEPALLRSAIG